MRSVVDTNSNTHLSWKDYSVNTSVIRIVFNGFMPRRLGLDTLASLCCSLLGVRNGWICILDVLPI